MHAPEAKALREAADGSAVFRTDHELWSSRPYTKTCHRFLGQVGDKVACSLKRPVSTLTFEGQGFTTRVNVGQWRPHATELVATAAEALGPCTVFWVFGFNDFRDFQVKRLPEDFGWVIQAIDAAHVFTHCDDGQGCSVPAVGQLIEASGRVPVSLPWPEAATAWAKHHWPEDTYHMSFAGLTEHWGSLARAIAHAIKDHGGVSGPVLLVSDSSFTSHDYARDVV